MPRDAPYFSGQKVRDAPGNVLIACLSTEGTPSGESKAWAYLPPACHLSRTDGSIWSPSNTREPPNSYGVLAVVLLLAANPAILLASPDQVNPASVNTAHDRLFTQDRCSGPCQFVGGLSVASIFPITSDRETPTRTEREVIGLGDDQADELFDALTSATAREILQRLSAEPRTATDLSEIVDTSLQNVHYHLENLREAGAIKEIDIEYSSRGREMSVYTATSYPQVVVYDIE